jgi:hypothetical protein
MGRRRWLEVLGGAGLGLVEREEALSGVNEEGRIGEVGSCESTGVET